MRDAKDIDKDRQLAVLAAERERTAHAQTLDLLERWMQRAQQYDSTGNPSALFCRLCINPAIAGIQYRETCPHVETLVRVPQARALLALAVSPVPLVRRGDPATLTGAVGPFGDD